MTRFSHKSPVCKLGTSMDIFSPSHLAFSAQLDCGPLFLSLSRTLLSLVGGTFVYPDLVISHPTYLTPFWFWFAFKVCECMYLFCLSALQTFYFDHSVYL